MYEHGERSLSRPDPSFIQQTMTWLLPFLKSLLTYKALLMVIPVVMICMLYESGDVSLRQKLPKTLKKRTLSKSHPIQRQSRLTGSFGSSNSIKRRHSPDVEREKVEIQQSQIVESQEPEAFSQQTSSNISKEETSKKPCSSQKKDSITEPLGSELPKKREKSEAKSSKIETGLSRNKLIGSALPKKDWVHTQYEGNQIYMYYPDSQKGNQWNHHSTSKVTILSDFFISHQSHDALWIHQAFYTNKDLVALAETSKYAYIQSKKFSNIMNNKKRNSCMLHRGYKTCVIDTLLRTQLVNFHVNASRATQFVINAFESFYTYLLWRANQDEPMSYEFFRVLFFSEKAIHVCDITVRHFFIRKFLEKCKWTYKELLSSKDALIVELIQAIKEYVQSPKYDFIPPVNQVMDQLSYERFLKNNQLTNVPFWNCPTIVQLFISSKDAPLKLFLFWDIFDALKMEVLFQVKMSYDEIPFLRGNKYIVDVKSCIIQLYSNQNEDYLGNLYFEMVDFIQQNFFRNDQLYKKHQSKQENMIAFDDYMRSIRKQVVTFLVGEVFIYSPVGIIVGDP